MVLPPGQIGGVAVVGGSVDGEAQAARSPVRMCQAPRYCSQLPRLSSLIPASDPSFASRASSNPLREGQARQGRMKVARHGAGVPSEPAVGSLGWWCR